MAIFGQEKGQLQVGLLFQLNGSIVLLQHFVGRVLGYGYQIVAQLNAQLWFVGRQDVIAQQEVNLKRVERKAVRADYGQVHDVVFGRLEQKGGLDDARQVTIGGQLEALLLGPHLNLADATSQLLAPILGAQTTLLLFDQHVEQPHAHVMKELGEELNGERRVHSTTTQQVHGLI